MIYKCNICGSEDNDPQTGEWCLNCNCFRDRIFPEKRDYSHDFIFEKYLNDQCPVCDSKVDCDSNYSHVESGGKYMAKYFRCRDCGSEYVVAYNRNRQPIKLEIIINNVYK